MPIRRVPAVLVCALAAAAGCRSPNLTYKGLKLVRPVVADVTNGDITRFLDRVRDQMAAAVPLPVGTALRKGQRALIDFAGRIGGTPFEGGTGSGVPLVLGSGQMIPGFEEGIVGMKAGQTKVITVTFPADYHEAELAGKKAEFTITVRGGESLVRPPLDADFCAKISGGQINDLGTLKKAVRQQLAQQNAQRAEQSLRSQIAEALLGQWNPEPSGRSINKELDRVVQQQLQAATRAGNGPAQGGPDPESIRKAARPTVVKGLRLSTVLARIAKLENIAVSDGEVEQFATQIAQSQGRPPQDYLAEIRQQNLVDVLRRQILENRVMQLIIQNAVITAPQPLKLKRG